MAAAMLPTYMRDVLKLLGTRAARLPWPAALVCVAMTFAAAPARAQEAIQNPEFAALVDRPISGIELIGLKRVSETEARNNIRIAVGDPFDPSIIKADLSRLNRLGHFKNVDATGVLQADGSVIVRFTFEEAAVIREVQVVGNKLIGDQDLLAVVALVPRGPRNDFLIQNAKRRIEDLYRERGHYLTTVIVDEKELEQAGVLIFRVIEGPRVKIRAIEFEGNEAFTNDQLHAEVKTRTAMFLLRKGQLDQELLADDVAALDRFYKDRGYLDVRVDRQIDLSPDNTEAKVTFVVAEGQPYTLRGVRATTWEGAPLNVFAPEMLQAMIELKPGDVHSYAGLRRSTLAIEEAYGLLGYLDVRVRPIDDRIPETHEVDLRVEIDEGKQYLVDEVLIQGNFLTKDKVIRRELRGLTPGRPFDGTQLEKSRERLLATRLFNDARITVQAPEQDDPLYRDVLVEVKERNTGSANFGVAIGSDQGVFGEFSLSQNNFDITDFPESFQELISGRAFRGAGQRFNMVLRPGTEIFQYSASWTEPHLFDSPYSLTVGGLFRDRFYDRYDETRFGGNVRIARQFGDVWAVGVQARAEQVELDDIDPFAPTEIFLDQGPDTLTSLGLTLTRTTITKLNRPGDGSRFEMSYDRYGALGGDFDFNLLNAEYTVFLTLDEDFLGRITTLRFNSRVGYIFGDRAPTYEQFYLGGRSFRGFDFRTISPKGIRADTGGPSDDPVGGEWLVFLGAQYEMPLLGDAMTGVVFVDSGTVLDDVSLDDYRVSAGLGIRLYIPQFGDVPIAFDFALPIRKLDDDDEQVFSFMIDFPF